MAINRRINSRTKGSRAERNFAKMVAKWTGKEFSRTPSSGGLQWKASNSKGDIVCTTEGHFFPFCIECKNHHEIDFNEFIGGRKNKPKVLEFWEQCTRDASKAGKIPLLAMHYRGLAKSEWIIAVTQNTFLHILGADELDHVRVRTKDFPEILILLNSSDFITLNYRKIHKHIKNNKSWLKNW